MGELREVVKLLGRHFSVGGEVIHGHNRGKGLGFPTANVVPDAERVWAAAGVYAGYAVLPDGRHALATVNIGVRRSDGGM